MVRPIASAIGRTRGSPCNPLWSYVVDGWRFSQEMDRTHRSADALRFVTGSGMPPSEVSPLMSCASKPKTVPAATPHCLAALKPLLKNKVTSKIARVALPKRILTPNQCPGELKDVAAAHDYRAA
jgi:hypothetical protein